DSIPLIREVLTLGRRDSCDIPLRLPNVSGQHCELSFVDGCWWLRDLGSTNGTKVNGVRVAKKRLNAGDRLTIAKRTYTIEYAQPEGVAAESEADDMENIFSQSLLEKAGLEKPTQRDPRR